MKVVFQPPENKISGEKTDQVSIDNDIAKSKKLINQKMPADS